MTQEGSGHQQKIFVSVLWIIISGWEALDESRKYIDILHMEGNINQKPRERQSAASYVLRIASFQGALYLNTLFISEEQFAWIRIYCS